MTLGEQARALTHRIASGWFIAWLVLTVVNVIGYGLRQHNGLPLYLEVANNYVQGNKIYLRPGIESTYDRFAYPPITAFPTVPLIHLPDLLQRILWCGFNAGLLVLSICLITKAARPMIESIARGRDKTVGVMFAIYWTLIGLVVIRHVLSPLENQSHDIIILACITVGITGGISRRESVVGLGWGAAAALKLTPLLYLPFLIVQGRFKAASIMLLVLAVLTIIPDLLIRNTTGQTHLEQYYEVIGTAARPGKSGGEGQWVSWNPLNQNLSGPIYRITAKPPVNYEFHDAIESWFPLVPMGDGGRRVVMLTLQFVLLIAVFLSAWWTRGPPRPTEERGLVELATAGVVMSMMLLLSPQSSKSHFVVLLVPTAAIVLHLLKTERDWIGVGILVSVGILGSLTGRDIIGAERSELLLAFGSVAMCSLLLGLGSLRACRSFAPRKREESSPAVVSD